MNRFILEDKDIKILGEKETNSLELNGGKGSGNWGHAGRPGEVGGSAPQGSTSASWRDLPDDAETLEFDSIEKVYLEDRGGWPAYKKKLYDKYSARYPDKKIVVRRTRMQTKGLLEYAVFGLKKDDEENSSEYVDYSEQPLRGWVEQGFWKGPTPHYFEDDNPDVLWDKNVTTEEQKKNLMVYTRDGSQPINDYLRAGLLGTGKNETIEKAVAAIDSTLKGKLGTDIVVYRAFRANDEFPLPKVGQVIDNAGYTSTSLDPEGMSEWLGKNRIKLKVKKGTNALHIGGDTSNLVMFEGETSTSDEQEVLFPRNAKIKITKANLNPTDEDLRAFGVTENFRLFEGELYYDNDKSKNSLELNGGKGSGNFGHSGRPGLVGGSAPAGTSPAVAIYVTGEEAKMDFDTILQRRDLQQKLKRMRKIDDFNDDVVAEMKKLQFTDEEIERWRAMILAKEVVHIMDRDKRREKRAQISDSAEQKEAIEKVVDSVEMEDKDKTWLRNNCDVEMAQALSREIDRAKESGIDKIRLKLNDSKSINGRMGYIAGRDEYELTLRKGLLRDTEQTKASRERQGPNGGRYKSSDDIGGTFAHEFGHALETVFAKSLVGDRGIAKSSMHMGEITSFTSRAIVEQAKRNVIAKGIGKEELFRNADNKYMSAYGRTNTREAIAESHANPNFSEFTREIENIVTRKVPIDKDLLDPILNRINFREKQYQEFLHGKD